MNTDSMTLGQLKELRSMFGGDARTHSLQVGEAVLIRTVTFFYTGRIARVTDSDVVLSEAAWIADTGRFGEALATGKLNEVEPYPAGVSVNREAIVDVSPWRHLLPREAK